MKPVPPFNERAAIAEVDLERESERQKRAEAEDLAEEIYGDELDSDAFATFVRNRRDDGLDEVRSELYYDYDDAYYWGW